MLTSKQRSKLKSMASTMPVVTSVGKNGITDSLLKSLSDTLEARELIKIGILENSGEDPAEVADNLAQLLDAEVVIVMGRKAVLYRYSSRDHYAHIEL
ncbi:MAG: YhbY family RNA-binding protein [Clostridia bacterium]|nr:YhbY family RNA-binding protein [Clostridia bacterium]